MLRACHRHSFDIADVFAMTRPTCAAAYSGECIMSNYEYKVVPAPLKGQRGKGIKGTDAQFANALQILMNENGAQGWEYQRTDTLPCQERSGLTRRTTSFKNMLVFRRQQTIATTTPTVSITTRPTPLVGKPPTAADGMNDTDHAPKVAAPSDTVSNNVAPGDGAPNGFATKHDPERP